ncbi:hypothetical protein O0L34_g14277 [Tuta absoluta]|nr:hypothetical protein O0L34_g14277 [Tuta absoluta]
MARAAVATAAIAALLVAFACLHTAAARPVRRTLNFNMFLLQPNKNKPDDRFLITTDGVSRFGPILEYFIQRVQGMMSVRVPENHTPPSNERVPLADAAENEVDGGQQQQQQQSRIMPGVVVRPSRNKPGTYEVEIDVLVDDGQPDARKNYNRI